MKTIKNLMNAFIGESQARNRYTMYAKVAKKEGYEKINEVFLLTAENETEHAKWLFRLINQLKGKVEENCDVIEINTGGPTILGNTIENLKSAIAGETEEHEHMYPEYAQIAEEEGFPEIAKRLRAIAQAEVHHHERFDKILKQLEAGTFFKKSEPQKWVCMKCGYVHEGEQGPEECPSCNHPHNYFELKCEKY
jgi:rubrerythrin